MEIALTPSTQAKPNSLSSSPAQASTPAKPNPTPPAAPGAPGPAELDGNPHGPREAASQVGPQESASQVGLSPSVAEVKTVDLAAAAAGGVEAVNVAQATKVVVKKEKPALSINKTYPNSGSDDD